MAWRNFGRFKFSRKHLRKLLYRIAQTLIGLFYMRAQKNIALMRLSDLTLNHDEDDPQVFCRELKVDDLAMIRKQFGDRSAKSFALKMQLATAFAGFIKEKIAGYTWFFKGPCFGEGAAPFFYDIRPKRDFIYQSGTYMIPEMRNKTLVRTLGNFSYSELKKSNYQYVFTTYDSHNLAIRPLISKYKFKNIGKIQFKKIFWHISKNLEDLKLVCDD